MPGNGHWEKDTIAPYLGKVVGYMDNAHANYVCMVGSVVDYGSLDTSYKKLFKTYNPRRNCEQYGNGACGNWANGSTITNYDWIHPYLQGYVSSANVMKLKLEKLMQENPEYFSTLNAKRNMELMGGIYEV